MGLYLTQAEGQVFGIGCKSFSGSIETRIDLISVLREDVIIIAIKTAGGRNDSDQKYL